jgi:hypothetical protein
VLASTNIMTCRRSGRRLGRLVSFPRSRSRVGLPISGTMITFSKLGSGALVDPH